jgi:predicted phage terminase large subunit-like protein
MAREGKRFWVEDLVHGRWSPAARDAVILQTAKLDGKGVEIVIEQEPGASGVAQIDALVAMLAGFRVRGLRQTGDKLTRAGPLASQAEAGNVQLVEGPWVKTFLDELCAFPEGGHDDIVDAASGAFLVLTEPAPSPLRGMVLGRGVKGW